MRPIQYLCPLLFCAVAFALFHAGFHASWYYDSAILSENEQAFAGQGILGVIDLFPQRPVVMASFYLNYLASGLSPYVFRAVNAVILGLTASALVAALVIVLNAPSVRTKCSASQRTWLAFFLGLLFLVHPVQTYMVLYVWQRMALLACFFYMAAFAVYLAARTARIRHQCVGYGICFVLFALAAASKENAVTLPAVLILAEVAFFRPGKKELLLRALIAAACLVAVMAMLSALERPHGTDAQSRGIVNTLAKYYQESGLTLGEVFITQCRLLFEYARIVVLPLPSKILLVSPQVIHGSLTGSLWSAFAVLGAVSAPILAFCILRSRPMSGFGLLFFIINLLPEAFLVPQFLFFVYRAALPMVGLLLVAADLCIALMDAAGSHRGYTMIQRGLTVAAIAAVVLAGSVTRSKAELWADPVLLWTEVVSAMPRQEKGMERRGTVNALNNLGIALQKSGNTFDAIPYHRRAVQVDPTDIRSLILLGKAYIREGRLAEAQSSMTDALKIVPDSAEAEMGLGIILAEENRLADAAKHAKRAVTLAPQNAPFRNDLGAILLKQGDFRAAAEEFTRAIELNPGFIAARYHLGKTLWAEGKKDEALRQYMKVLQLKPDHTKARNDLAALLASRGQVDEAIEQLRAILQVNPNDTLAKANLAGLLERLRSTRERAAPGKD